MLHEQSTHDGGMSIVNHKFNVYYYADGVLLASTTVTGI